MRKLTLVLAAGALAVTGLVAPALATFKGANGRLLYQVPVGDYEQLFSVKPDGSGARQLTDFPDSGAWDAAWSPDATQIAFVRRWGPNKDSIYTMNADGSGQRELDRLLHGTPAWLPDGKHLLVLRKLRWTIVTPSGGAPRFAGMPGAGDSPCVFADGKHVAFQASFGRTDGKEAIMVGRDRRRPEEGAADHAVAADGGQDRLLARRHEDRLQRTALRATALGERLRHQRRWHGSSPTDAQQRREGEQRRQLVVARRSQDLVHLEP